MADTEIKRARVTEADHVKSIRSLLMQLCGSLTEAQQDGHTITFVIHNDNGEFKLNMLKVATEKSVL